MEIAGYTVIEPLGRDQVSNLYLVKKENYRARYVIRILTEEAAADAETATALLAGAKRALDMANPHLVRVCEYGEYEGRPFCVMDYVPGSNLATKQTDMCLLDKVYVVKEVAEVLQYLAKFGFAHGHLSLSNIFISDVDSRVIINGFGLDAVMVSLADGWSAIHLDTAVFMSLEQLGGGDVTERSDIYSLGVVFYSLIAGKPPYEVETTEQLWDRLNEATIPKLPDQLNTFQHIIDRMLAPTPEDRYANAADFIAELDAISDEQILVADNIGVEQPAALEITVIEQNPVVEPLGQQKLQPPASSDKKVVSLASRLEDTADEDELEEGESEIARTLIEHPEIFEAATSAVVPDPERPRLKAVSNTPAEITNKSRDVAVASPQVRTGVGDTSSKLSKNKGQPKHTAKSIAEKPPARKAKSRRDDAGAKARVAAGSEASVAVDSAVDNAVDSARMSAAKAPRGSSAKPANTAITAKRKVSSAQQRGTQGNQVDTRKHRKPAQPAGIVQASRRRQDDAPEGEAVASDSAGHQHQARTTQRLLILSLLAAGLITVTIFMLPAGLQLQLFDEVIAPLRQSIFLAFESLSARVGALFN